VRETPRTPEPAGSRTGFWLYAGNLWSVFGIAISNGLLVLSLLSVPFAFTGRARREATAAFRRGRKVLLALAAYAVLLVVASFSSLDPGRSLRGTTELFNLCVLPLGLLLVRGESRVRTVVDGIGLVGGLLALVGLGQFVLGYNDLSQRITGPFSHYMTFSGVLLLADLLLLARVAVDRDPERDRTGPRLLSGTGRWPDAWRWVALGLINAALLATYTRNVWVGLAVALTLLQIARKPKLLLLYPVAGVLFWMLAPAPVLDRVASIADLSDPSNQDRVSMGRAGLAMIADRPLTGLGPEMVEVLYPNYRVATAVRDHVPHLHNSFLQIAAERGVPALLAYLAMVGFAFAGSWRRFRREGGFHGPRADLYLGVLLVLVGFNVAGLFEHNWGDTEVQRHVLFLLALPFCMPREAPAGEAERVER
jgi:O-antigen ligase